jgi:hypothetical protein
LTPSTPSIARIYDYLLGGKDNFAADREVAERLLAAGRADDEGAKAGFGACSSGGTKVYNHSVSDFASFFGPLDLVQPGVVDSREWRPDWAEPMHLPPRDGQVIAGVARTS